MSLNERLIGAGGTAVACTTDTTDVFGDGSGIALYTMDYDASDASGSYDGVPTNVEFGVEGQINYGAGFNGSSASITLPNSVGNFSDTSVSVWFNLNTTSGTQTIIEFDYYNRILFRATSTDANYAYIGNSGYFNHGITFAANQWYHLVITFSNGNPFNIYVNGNLEYTSGNTSIFANSIDNILGSGNASGGDSLNGKLDQVRIFSKALDSNEVSTLYAETACVYTCTTDTVDYPTTNVAYYKLDNSAEDETGTYDGTATNVNYTFGRFGQAAVFNGSSSEINLNSAVLPASVFSVSMWFNLNTINRRNYLITQYILAAGSNGRFEFAVESTNDFVIYLEGSALTFTTSVSLTSNNWYNVVLVKNGASGWSCYLDGQSLGTNSDTRNIYTGDNTRLGKNVSISSGILDGSLDQVRIFSSALTSTQVTELYEEYECEDTSTFQTVLYTGNGSTQYISNVGFEPDLVWIKERSSGSSHNIADVVRGSTNYLSSNLTNAQNNLASTISSFDSNGFSVGNDGAVNQSAQTYVAWCWKAGGIAVSNTDGTITTQVSANVDAGFSIVKYTGNNSSSATIGHGLGKMPAMVITKMSEQNGGASSTSQWMIYHKDLTGNVSGDNPYNLYFTGDAELDLTAFGAYDNITTDVIPVTRTSASTAHNNNNLSTYVAYCFAEIAGYSKMGSYEGLGTSTVTVSDVGFKPSFIIVKNIDAAANWGMYDLRRSTVPDRANGLLYPNLSNAEVSNSSTYYFDMNDNGFVVSASNHEQQNKAGRTYLYMVFK